MNNTFEIEALCYKDLGQIEIAIEKIKLALELTEKGKYKDSLSETLESFVSAKEGV